MAYYLGRTGKTIFRRLHKKPSKQDEEKSHSLLLKYGWIAIFFSAWVPILGDVIPIAAGVKKYDFCKFAVAMSVGKTIKVLVIIYVSSFFATTFLQ